MNCTCSFSKEKAKQNSNGYSSDQFAKEKIQMHPNFKCKCSNPITICCFCYKFTKNPQLRPAKPIVHIGPCLLYSCYTQKKTSCFQKWKLDKISFCALINPTPFSFYIGVGACMAWTIFIISSPQTKLQAKPLKNTSLSALQKAECSK